MLLWQWRQMIGGGMCVVGAFNVVKCKWMKKKEHAQEQPAQYSGVQIELSQKNFASASRLETSNSALYCWLTPPSSPLSAQSADPSLPPSPSTTCLECPFRARCFVSPSKCHHVLSVSAADRRVPAATASKSWPRHSSRRVARAGVQPAAALGR